MQKLDDGETQMDVRIYSSITFYGSICLCLFVNVSYAICSHFEEFGMLKLNKLLLFHHAFHSWWSALDCRKTNLKLVRNVHSKSKGLLHIRDFPIYENTFHLFHFYTPAIGHQRKCVE